MKNSQSKEVVQPPVPELITLEFTISELIAMAAVLGNSDPERDVSETREDYGSNAADEVRKHGSGFSAYSKLYQALEEEGIQ